jgi:hypothetical protein
MDRTEQLRMREVRLQWSLTDTAARTLEPFLVECDVQGGGLFGMANTEVNETFEKLYEGLPQPALKRLGEVILPTDEVL